MPWPSVLCLLKTPTSCVFLVSHCSWRDVAHCAPRSDRNSGTHRESGSVPEWMEESSSWLFGLDSCGDQVGMALTLSAILDGEDCQGIDWEITDH